MDRLTVRGEAEIIAFRLERYTRPDWRAVCQRPPDAALSRGQCDQLDQWRKIGPLEEFSALWVRKVGAMP